MSSLEEGELESGGGGDVGVGAPPSLASVAQTLTNKKPPFYWTLLLLNLTLMALGSGGPLLLRDYFLHGGKRLWLSSLVQMCGWPLILIPIFVSYLRRRRREAGAKVTLLTPVIAAGCAVIGVLMGLSSYLYAYGTSYLPLSTSALLVATQLAFTAGFAFLLVRQRFTAYSVNSVVLLTMGPVVLSLHAGGDMPEGETRRQYYSGFFMTIAASATLGLLMPMMEVVCRMGKAKMSYAMVMEMQVVMGVFGTLFCLIGMLANNDFQAIPKEARNFGLGKMKYYMVLIWDTIFWQFLNLGLLGVISSVSSLLGGILIAVTLPVSEILAVIFLHEKFDGGKGVALVLCLWGFVSYLYGEKKNSMKLEQKTPEMEPNSFRVPIEQQSERGI